METQIKSAIPFYFEELKRRQQQESTTKGPSRDLPITNGIEILRALKEAKDYTLPLITLARKVNIKVGPCQELSDELENEGLITIDRDDEMGNDWITLTEKGLALI